MKHRNGFVSNSSSSSFVIFGLSDPDEEVIDKFHEHFESLEEYPDYYDEYEEHEGLIVKDTYIGKEVDMLPMDKTLNDVKIDIVEKIREITGIDIDVANIKFYEDTIYD